MKTSQNGIALIKKFEGLRLEAYKCAAGVWTCGYGSTNGVQEGDVWSESYAEERLEADLITFEEGVSDNVTAPINQDQFDALVAWSFNVGIGNLKTSTMLKVLNAGSYDDVPAQMRRWNKATVNGEKVVLEGLVRRRKAESMLFEGNDDWVEV